MLGLEDAGIGDPILPKVPWLLWVKTNALAGTEIESLLEPRILKVCLRQELKEI